MHEREAQLACRIEGRRIEFAQDVRAAHRQLRTNLLRWLAQSSWPNALPAPFIYALIVPSGLVDLSLTLYRAVCFRLYQVPRVARADYIVIDRHRLEYLNALRKPNCVYCGHANGLIAYAREIASRTGDCEGAAPSAPERSHPRIVAQHRSAALIGAQA